MGIKSDKTFEEIVERLVAVFRPKDDSRSEHDAGYADRRPTATVDSRQDIPGPPTSANPSENTDSL